MADETDDSISMSVTTGLIAGRAIGDATAAGTALEATIDVTRQVKAVGYAIYDAPAGLRKFLKARASGNVSPEELKQLSADAMEEQRSRKPKAELIDFENARREREQGQRDRVDG
jgi:hypothetical protein